MGPKPERNPDKSYPKPRPDMSRPNPGPNSHILGSEADSPDPSPTSEFGFEARPDSNSPWQ